MVAADVLAVVDVNDSTQALQGSLVKITLAQLYRTEFTPVTVSTPLPDIAQTWNAGGVTFTAVKLNVTDTASAAASLLLDLQVGGVSKFSVRKDGTISVVAFGMIASNIISITTNATASPTGLTIAPSTHATSRRSALALDNWLVGQDYTSAGPKDFFVYDIVNTALRWYINTTGATVFGANAAAPGAAVNELVLLNAKALRGFDAALSTTIALIALNAAGNVSIDSGGAGAVFGGTLTLTPAVSRVVPGATSLSFRNNANGLDNLIILDNGNVTVRGTLTATGGVVAAAGTLTGATLAANVVTSSLTSVGTLASLTVGAGATALGGSLSVTGGDVTVSAGNLLLSTAASKIVPGATSLSIRDTANANDNLIVLNNGNTTIRGTLTVTGGMAPGNVLLGNGNAVSIRNVANSAYLTFINVATTSNILQIAPDSASNLVIGNSTGSLGFFGTSASARLTITGSRGGNLALASLLSQLANYGLLIDSST
jgi:phage baseplate assembly protein gpV